MSEENKIDDIRWCVFHFSSQCLNPCGSITLVAVVKHEE